MWGTSADRSGSRVREPGSTSLGSAPGRSFDRSCSVLHPSRGPAYLPPWRTVPPTPPHIQKLGDLAAEAGIRRIHVLAWRDLDDVEAGGSEVHAHEISKLWAEAGIEVVHRTSFAQGHPVEVQRSGYQVVRRAGRYLVFPRAAAAEAFNRNGRRDALVEIWNGMPFFSPLWSRGPRVVFLHHVHADMWKMVLPPRLARLGDTIESRIGPRVYRRSHMVTLSESSKAEMLEIGFRDELVDVVPPGIDPRFRPGGDRSTTPLVLAVGRLVPVKRFDRLIRAAVRAREQVPGLELRIVGTGPEREALDSLVASLGAEHIVTFTGRVDDDELVSLYQQAWVVASTSVREGWGMTLTEAAACGTPAVATRIAGHEDAVAEGRSGLLADDDDQLVAHLVAITTDGDLRARLQAGALEHAGRFTWTNTATQILQALAFEAERHGRST
ncbi:MAG: glycosyltransferase family 4 protein [Actinobacteria bacterium]|nr:glycosyltransferase family 4 protein [Actinomycetota bacterium]